MNPFSRIGLSVALSYIVANAAIGIDVLFKSDDPPSHERSSLDVSRYAVRVDGKTKYLTLVGEMHIYTRQESEQGKMFLKEHSDIAYEIASSGGAKGSEEDLSKERMLFRYLEVPKFYIGLALARHDTSIYELAAKENRYVHSLETLQSRWACISEEEYGEFKYKGILGTVFHPLLYLATRLDDLHQDSPEEEEKSIRKFSTKYPGIISKRDSVMARSIDSLLHNKDIDTLLAVVGKGHLPGIAERLIRIHDFTSVAPQPMQSSIKKTSFGD